MRRDGWREAYSSSVYRSNRGIVINAAGGRCTRVLTGGRGRCREPATEAGHIVPLSRARDLAEALELCRRSNLEAVCRAHNPRGGDRSRV